MKQMNHEEFFKKNDWTRLLPESPVGDPIKVEDFYQAIKGRMLEEVINEYGFVPSKPNEEPRRAIEEAKVISAKMSFVDPKPYGAVPDKANNNVVKFCTDITIPAGALIEVGDGLWYALTPRVGRLVSVALEFAED